ncbi:response regulator [Marinobacter manganoxydans]|jgi:DNA-binding response OmpR family regulator|uniref:GGDEF domain-containing protein n=1 Tax=Marinobacter manganoxydans MnI7-9 TaxID=1094979 RepID=G6YYG6_9GAMM|nr:response regulator [Marinobacter manganoxydans]EHJ02769.1 GGDEF domain-containing protein [Marinobacter manganoxydans MnI7-9]|tara:strand:+ start:449 stop:1627 length:1179 start_codon:yes stop_codon:yes gene_type:complete
MQEKDLSQQRARLQALRENYVARMPETFERLEHLIGSIPAQDLPSESGDLNSTLTLLVHEVHKLAGSSGSLGLHCVSEAARQLMSLAELWHTHPQDPITKKDLMAKLIATMRECDTESTITEKKEPTRKGSRKIHIVDDDELLAQEMLTWLLEAGFDAEAFFSSSVYLDIFETLSRPDMIIMDVAFGEDTAAGPDTVRQLRNRLGRMPAVIFLSVHDEMPARLAALRAGASRYLVKPISKTRLMDIAHEFAERKHTPKYRVLMVDDDQTVLQAAKIQLEQIGLEVHATDEPLQALRTARQINPDVIILDIMMPEVSGTELAAILREDRQFDATPIVFLTSQTHQDEKTLSVALGGDDYILKPFDADYLTATIFSRAKRSRRLRQLISESAPG